MSHDQDVTTTTATTTTGSPQAATRSEGNQVSSPAVAQVQAMLADGKRDPQAAAQVLAANPAARGEILTLLHQTVGNAFVGEVLQLLAPVEAATAGPSSSRTTR